MSEPLKSLTAKRERFCLEYLRDLNATQAATRAGYSLKTAKAQGARLLTNVDVAARIAELQDDRAARLQVTADKVLRELARIGFSDIGDYVEVSRFGLMMKDPATLTPDQRAAIAEISETVTDKSRNRRFKLHDKVAALLKLGQHLGLFTERLEHSGPGGGRIEVRTLTPAQRVARIQELLMLGAARANGNGKQ
jgi:phage terminase small subunit